MKKWIFGQILLSMPSLVTVTLNILIAVNDFQKLVYTLSITWSKLDIQLRTFAAISRAKYFEAEVVSMTGLALFIPLFFNPLKIVFHSLLFCFLGDS